MDPELKKELRKYLKLVFWGFCNFENELVPEKHYQAVLDEVGRIEERLIAEGIKPQQIDDLNKLSSSIADKPLFQLPENQQIMIIESIFGKGGRL